MRPLMPQTRSNSPTRTSMPQTRSNSPTQASDDGTAAHATAGTAAPAVRTNAELVKEDTRKYFHSLNNVLCCFKRMGLSSLNYIDVTLKMDRSTLVYLKSRLEEESRLLKDSKDALHKTGFPAGDEDQRFLSSIEQSLYAARDKIVHINSLLLAGAR